MGRFPESKPWGLMAAPLHICKPPTVNAKKVRIPSASLMAAEISPSIQLFKAKEPCSLLHVAILFKEVYGHKIRCMWEFS